MAAGPSTVVRTFWAMAVAMAIGSCGPAAEQPAPPASTTTTRPPIAADAPSQSETDARRDGVVAAVAELPPPRRIRRLVEASATEGLWLLSRLPDATIRAAMEQGGMLGDADGSYPTDLVYPVE